MTIIQRVSAAVERRVDRCVEIPVGDPQWNLLVNTVLGMNPRRRWVGINDKRQPTGVPR